jgi:hypothetical protein
MTRQVSVWPKSLSCFPCLHLLDVESIYTLTEYIPCSTVDCKTGYASTASFKPNRLAAVLGTQNPKLHAILTERPQQTLLLRTQCIGQQNAPSLPLTSPDNQHSHESTSQHGAIVHALFTSCNAMHATACLLVSHSAADACKHA